MKPAPIFVCPLESHLLGGTTVRISSRETGGAYCVCEMATMPGDGVALHVHDLDEEFYYILEGTYEMQVGDERFCAAVGSMVVIPREVPHAFRNVADGVARALMIFRPGGFDEMLGELRQAAAAGNVDQLLRRTILGKWGITFLDGKP